MNGDKLVNEEQDGVIFQSNQSYYSLFDEAKISWKKKQKKNPLRDEKLVQETKKEIEKTRGLARRNRE